MAAPIFTRKSEPPGHAESGRFMDLFRPMRGLTDAPPIHEDPPGFKSLRF